MSCARAWEVYFSGVLPINNPRRDACIPSAIIGTTFVFEPPARALDLVGGLLKVAFGSLGVNCAVAELETCIDWGETEPGPI